DGRPEREASCTISSEQLDEISRSPQQAGAAQPGTRVRLDLWLHHQLVPVEESPVLDCDDGPPRDFAVSAFRSDYRLQLVPMPAAALPDPPPGLLLARVTVEREAVGEGMHFRIEEIDTSICDHPRPLTAVSREAASIRRRVLRLK